MRSRSESVGIGCAFAVVLVVGVVGLVVWYGVTNYQVARDTDALVHRAQVAGSADDMQGYLVQLQGNLRAYGMDRGHSALVFKRPDNSFELDYKAVGNVIERLDGIKSLDERSNAYQAGLDDCRGIMRELRDPANGYMWVHYECWMIPVGIVMLGLSVLFIKPGEF
jgi:hypothetical protein